MVTRRFWKRIQPTVLLIFDWEQLQLENQRMHIIHLDNNRKFYKLMHELLTAKYVLANTIDTSKFPVCASEFHTEFHTTYRVHTADACQQFVHIFKSQASKIWFIL